MQGVKPGQGVDRAGGLQSRAVQSAGPNWMLQGLTQVSKVLLIPGLMLTDQVAKPVPDLGGKPSFLGQD